MKHKILAHVQKHHKKYLFAGGLAFGWGIATIMVIIAGGIGVSIFSGRSSATDAQLKMYQALATFNQIEDMSHQYDEKIHTLGYANERTGDIGYHQTEKLFHDAKNLTEKFRAARQMDEFIHQQHDFLQKKGYINSAEDAKFYQIETLFDQIQ